MTLFKTCSLAIGLACLSLTAQAEDTPATSKPWQWGINAGWQRYSEPIMQLQGPEVGLLSRWQISEAFKLEGQLSLARLEYTSTNTGSMSNVPQTEASLRLLGPAASLGRIGWVEPTLQWSYTHNDLRGQSSTGNLGYERHLNNLWAGLRWSTSPALTDALKARLSLDLQTLVEGRQLSKLSQANPAYGNVLTQTQGGWAWGLQLRMPSAYGELEPYVRWQHLNRSNRVFNGVGYSSEPEHHKLWIGMNWWMN